MTHFLTTQIAHHGYVAVIILMLVESACIPIPSEVIMLFGGALAGGMLAPAHPHVSLFGVGLAGAAGNLAGALIAYAVGRLGGRTLLERHVPGLLMPARHLGRAERFFTRRGDRAVLIGRVLPVVRTFISVPAGVARMPVGRFAAYTMLGNLVWTFALAAAGYVAAARWHTVASNFEYVSVVVGAVLAAFLTRWMLSRLRSRRDGIQRRHNFYAVDQVVDPQP